MYIHIYTYIITYTHTYIMIHYLISYKKREILMNKIIAVIVHIATTNRTVVSS